LPDSGATPARGAGGQSDFETLRGCFDGVASLDKRLSFAAVSELGSALQRHWRAEPIEAWFDRANFQTWGANASMLCSGAKRTATSDGRWRFETTRKGRCIRDVETFGLGDLDFSAPRDVHGDAAGSRSTPRSQGEECPICPSRGLRVRGDDEPRHCSTGSRNLHGEFIGFHSQSATMAPSTWFNRTCRGLNTCERAAP